MMAVLWAGHYVSRFVAAVLLARLSSRFASVFRIVRREHIQTTTAARSVVESRHTTKSVVACVVRVPIANVINCY